MSVTAPPQALVNTDIFKNMTLTTDVQLDATNYGTINPSATDFYLPNIHRKDTFWQLEVSRIHFIYPEGIQTRDIKDTLSDVEGLSPTANFFISTPATVLPPNAVQILMNTKPEIWNLTLWKELTEGLISAFLDRFKEKN